MTSFFFGRRIQTRSPKRNTECGSKRWKRGESVLEEEDVENVEDVEEEEDAREAEDAAAEAHMGSKDAA